MIPVYYSWAAAQNHFRDHPDETCVVRRRRWYWFGWLEATVHCLQQAAEFYGKKA